MSRPDPGDTHSVELNRAPIAWALDQGKVSFFGIPSAMFWLDPSMLRMLVPLVEEVGVPLFQLLVAHQSSIGTDEDYDAMVTALGKTFEEGFLAWGRAVSAAGWGRFEMPSCDAATSSAVVIVRNPWELQMQRSLPSSERWGCPFLRGKIIGIFSHAFGRTCWADERHTVSDGDTTSIEMHIYPSGKTIINELNELRLRHHEEERRRLTSTTRELRQSQERQRAILSSLGEVVFTLDKEYRFTSYHVPRDLAVTYERSSDVMWRPVTEVMPPAAANSIIEAARAIFEDGEPRTVSYERERSGITRYISAKLSILKDLEARADGITGIERDMTDRVLSERALEEKLRLIEQQQEAIRAMSTPILQVWKGVLALPIVGTMDSSRSEGITQELLQAITRLRARYAVLDLTGVEVIDTQAADHFMRIIRAASLLGARCLVCGIRPAVAQTMAALGSGLERAATFATMQDALRSVVLEIG